MISSLVAIVLNDCGIYLHSFESVASFLQDRGNCLPLQFLHQSHPDEQHQNKSNDNLLPKVTLLLKLIVKRWRAVSLGTLRPLGSLHKVTPSREISMATKRAGNPRACSHQLTTPHCNEFSGTYSLYTILPKQCPTARGWEGMKASIHKDLLNAGSQTRSTKISSKPQSKQQAHASTPQITQLLENPTSHNGMGLTLPKLCSATFERHTTDMIISVFMAI